MSAPHAAGVLLVARDTGRILLVRRAPHLSHPLSWTVPGGRLDRGESARAAAARELAEEAGIVLPVARLRPLVEAKRRADGHRFALFAAEVPREVPARLDRESAEARWASLRALPRPLHPGLAAVLGR